MTLQDETLNKNGKISPNDGSTASTIEEHQNQTMTNQEKRVINAESTNSTFMTIGKLKEQLKREKPKSESQKEKKKGALEIDVKKVAEQNKSSNKDKTKIDQNDDVVMKEEEKIEINTATAWEAQDEQRQESMTKKFQNDFLAPKPAKPQ